MGIKRLLHELFASDEDCDEDPAEDDGDATIPCELTYHDVKLLDQIRAGGLSLLACSELRGGPDGPAPVPVHLLRPLPGLVVLRGVFTTEQQVGPDRRGWVTRGSKFGRPVVPALGVGTL